MSKKRIAQLSRSLGLARDARDKARDGIQSLVYPARQWYMIHEATSSDAQCELGRICHDFEESPTKAARWFRKSAEQGNADAQYRLGDMYYEGKGVALDPTEAAKWYRKAAEQGDSDAQSMLGHMYLKGNGVALDFEEAAKWYRKSSDQGDKLAQIWLGCAGLSNRVIYSH
jgi:TPR repeat protein